MLRKRIGAGRHEESRDPRVSSARRRAVVGGWLDLCVLWAFGIVQPLFKVLADSPEFFVARGNTRWDIVILAFGLTLIPPTLLIAIELAFTPLRRVQRLLHLLFVAVLVAVIALQIGEDSIGGSSSVLIPLALGVGVAVAVAYASTQVVPSIIRVLSPAPLIFLALFLGFSRVSELVFPQDEGHTASANIRSETPVVFVILDEFSLATLMDGKERINEARYPNFARLASESTWYRHATTVADKTAQAVPAILTGTRPPRDALPIASRYPHNLFTLLGGHYSLDVEESATRLCPKSLCKHRVLPSSFSRLESLVSDLSVVSLHLILPKDQEAHLPRVDRTFGNFRNGGPPAAKPDLGTDAAGIPLATPFANAGQHFLDFVARVDNPPGRPPLHFLHVQLPHNPWRYLPSGQLYPVLGFFEGGGDLWSRNPIFARQGLQRYLLQLVYVDRLLGRLIDRLRATGLYRRALVVVTADHGISFRPGLPARAVTTPTFPDIAGVPLFIKAPGQRRGRVDDRSVRTIDILPTVADELGVRLPWRIDGRSVATSPKIGNPRLTVTSLPQGGVTMRFSDYRTQLSAAVQRIVGQFGAGRAGNELFDAGSDPELIGRRVDQLPTAPGENTKVELYTPQAYRSVHPHGAIVPAFVAGRLASEDGEGKRIAIAVNGRIRAIAVTFVESGEVRFGAVVPPSAFHSGSNTVETFALLGQGHNHRLASFVQGGSGS